MQELILIHRMAERKRKKRKKNYASSKNRMADREAKRFGCKSVGNGSKDRSLLQKLRYLRLWSRGEAIGPVFFLG